MKHISTIRTVTPRGVVRRPAAPTLARTVGSAAQIRRADSDSNDSSSDDDRDRRDRRDDDDKDSDGD